MDTCILSATFCTRSHLVSTPQLFRSVIYLSNTPTVLILSATPATTGCEHALAWYHRYCCYENYYISLLIALRIIHSSEPSVQTLLQLGLCNPVDHFGIGSERQIRMKILPTLFSAVVKSTEVVHQRKSPRQLQDLVAFAVEFAACSQ